VTVDEGVNHPPLHRHLVEHHLLDPADPPLEL